MKQVIKIEVRDESGALLGTLGMDPTSIGTDLRSIRLPYLIREGIDPVYGQLSLDVRQWRSASGRIEPFLSLPREHTSLLEKVVGFVK